MTTEYVSGIPTAYLSLPYLNSNFYVNTLAVRDYDSLASILTDISNNLDNYCQ